MSTRCNIRFMHGDKVHANIYRHTDGYPQSIIPDLRRFFADVLAQTADTRFSDASYLAAKYVVWQAHEFTRPYEWEKHERNMLDFISLGVVMNNAMDGEYIYELDCDTARENAPPRITVYEASNGRKESKLDVDEQTGKAKEHA